MAQLLSNTRIYGFANIDGQLSVGNVTSYSTTSNTTGSLIVTGGMGITGNIYIGGANSRLTFPDGTSMNTASSGGSSSTVNLGLVTATILGWNLP